MINNNNEFLKILKYGVEDWNLWRENNSDVKPDLSHADLRDIKFWHDNNSSKENLSLGELFGEEDIIKADLNQVNLNGANLIEVNLRGIDLRKANLSNSKLLEANLEGANLSDANLGYADLYKANLEGANLSDANLGYADLYKANLEHTNLSKANLQGANLWLANLNYADLNQVNLNSANLMNAKLGSVELIKANLIQAKLIRADLRSANLREAKLLGSDLRVVNLTGADLSNADLKGANLMHAILINTNLERANLTGCRVYGVSAWNLKLLDTKQKDLIITMNDEPTITVDNLEVAQFIYLLLHNKKIQDVFNTISKKGVLILGRFTPVERKTVLESIRKKLRELDFLPIVFDFERPHDMDFTEVIKILAGMSCFIIADITNPKSSPLELQATVPDYMIPFVPIIQNGEKPFAMFKDLANKYDWVLKPVIVYDSVPNLMKGFKKGIIEPALEMHDKLNTKKAEELDMRNIVDYSDELNE